MDRGAQGSGQGDRHGGNRAQRLLDRHTGYVRERQLASSVGASLLRKNP
jgi:hypothetical protein